MREVLFRMRAFEREKSQREEVRMVCDVSHGVLVRNRGRVAQLLPVDEGPKDGARAWNEAELCFCEQVCGCASVLTPPWVWVANGTCSV